MGKNDKNLNKIDKDKKEKVKKEEKKVSDSKVPKKEIKKDIKNEKSKSTSDKKTTKSKKTNDKKQSVPKSVEKEQTDSSLLSSDIKTDHVLVQIKTNEKDKPLKKKNLNRNRFNILELLLLITIAFISGIFVRDFFASNSINNNYPQMSIKRDDSIDSLYESIINNYYKEIDKDKLKDAAINGMMNYLQDNYSIYFTEEEKEQFNEELDGAYYGIGLRVSLDDNNSPYVLEVFDNTPSSKAGVQVLDKILSIDNIDVSSPKNLNEVVDLIKGQKGKTVNIVFERNGSKFSKTITAEVIDIPSVTSKLIEKNDKKIGYIYIYLFAQNTGKQFKNHLDDLEKQNIDSLIIDVRNNVGGHLSSVYEILNIFYGKSDCLYQTNRKGVIEKTFGTGTRQKQYDKVILVNEISASGSEILAGAFSELSNVPLVGKKTFGKGTVQQTVDTSTGGMIKITTETWLTSKGNTINGTGLTPTYEVLLGDDYVNDPTDEHDTQLQKAIDILSN